MNGPNPTAAVRRDGQVLRRLAHDRAGNAAVEMAFAAVPLVLFLFGIIATGQATSDALLSIPAGRLLAHWRRRSRAIIASILAKY
jgi:hypothetical protein